MRTILLAITMGAVLGNSSLIGEDRIQVEGTKVSFVAPSGFKPVAKDIVATKWPKNQAPRFVIGNESATTTIAYDLKPNKVSPDKFAELQAVFKKVMGQSVPGIDWKKNEVIEIAGKKWIYMEMTSAAVDTNIYNIMLISDWDGKMLIFNFNSTKEDFQKYEKELRASVQSMRVDS